MDNRIWLRRLVALALVLPLAACADRETEADLEMETEPPATVSPTEPAAPMTIRLEPVGAGTVSGEATAMHGPDEVRVQVSLSGLVEDVDYEATLRYGQCSTAQTYLDEDDRPDAGVGTTREPIPEPIPGTVPEATPDADLSMDRTDREPGEEFADIDLDVTGSTATGSVEVDLDELGPDQDAYLLVTTDDEGIVACGDLRGHGTPGGAGR